MFPECRPRLPMFPLRRVYGRSGQNAGWRPCSDAYFRHSVRAQKLAFSPPNMEPSPKGHGGSRQSERRRAFGCTSGTALFEYPYLLKFSQ